MGFANRYALLTVDTEALPKRAAAAHVDRLIWGRHPGGSAGVREICSIGREFDARHVFFVDMCGAHRYPEEMRDVVRWLDGEEQDVQLHLHPEVLPKEFWSNHGFDSAPAYMNEYTMDERAFFVLKHFGGQLAAITGKKVLACRAGSFRWNGCFIRALRMMGIPLSFNNSMRAHKAGRSPFAQSTNIPYVWSNGVIEVPVTEKRIEPTGDKPERWVSLTYPESTYFPFRTRFFSRLQCWGGGPSFAVLLMHSWSFLYWNEKRQAVYLDDRRLEGYRALLARVSKDYDIVTTAELLDLHSRGKVPLARSVDVAKADTLVTA